MNQLLSGRLSGHVVIVSGGTRGMGEATVHGIVRHGGKVVFGGRDEEAGRTIAAELGDDAMFVRQDVGKSADWEAIVAATLGRFGKITGLVNNAGYASSGNLVSVKEPDILKTIEVNQLGVILGMQAVIPAMKTNGAGSIINVSSPAGIKGHPGITAYSGAKAAVIGMTRSAALELAHRNIRVNAVIPGFFGTRLLDESSNGAGREIGAKLTPMKRIAMPEEIVGPVVFLLSDDSSFVTGAQLAVDGGYTA